MHDQDVDEDCFGGKGDHTPYMLFYTSDWTAGTVNFTLEQRGFYFEALKTMWESKGGLPDDLQWLRGALRCDIRTARRLRSFLLNKGKLYVKDNLLMNRRMMRDIAQWKRKQAAKVGKHSAESQGTLALIFPDSPTKSTAPPANVPPHNQNPYPEKKEDRSSFEPRVIDGGKSRPAQVPRFVSEDALEQVRKLAPGWDRQALLKKFMAWPLSKTSDTDIDTLFLRWVPKFTKGKQAS